MKHKFRSWNKVFRSWNEELKQFFYFEGGIYQRCGIDRDEFNLSLFKWQNAEQGIGLKDVKEKEAFENDIITDESKKVFQVVWNGSVGVWCYLNLKTKELMAIYRLCDFEIIGNIHQNKELLEENNDRI